MEYISAIKKKQRRMKNKKTKANKTKTNKQKKQRMPFAAAWMDLEVIMLSEVRQ